jgi:D-alanine transaminase
MRVYFNNQLLELNKVKVSPFDRGFLFADGVYESIRAYKGIPFKYDEHLNRLKRSLTEIRLKCDVINSFKKIILQLAEINYLEGKDFSVYIQITRGVSFPRKHSFSSEDEEPTVFISISGIEDNLSSQQNGVKVILREDLRWLRCDIKSVSLLPAVLANQSAVESGAVESILYREDFITEGTHTNFFGVVNGNVVTAPQSNFILAGITRKVVLDLCKELNIKTEEKFIKINELNSFDEFFITSTTKEIFPVVQIDDACIGNGKPGKITIQLLKAFKELSSVSKNDEQ